jgi:hypothetical protein
MQLTGQRLCQVVTTEHGVADRGRCFLDCAARRHHGLTDAELHREVGDILEWVNSGRSVPKDVGVVNIAFAGVQRRQPLEFV